MAARFARLVLSAAVLIIFVAQSRATELYAYPRPAHAGGVPCDCEPAAAGLPAVVYGPAVPQYIPVRPYYLVDQGPSYEGQFDPYSYAGTDDVYGAGIAYGGYAFAGRPYYRHRRSYEYGVSVYRGPVGHAGAYRRTTWPAHRPWIAGRVSPGGPHAIHHVHHRMHRHDAGPRLHLHARPGVRTPMRHRVHP